MNCFYFACNNVWNIVSMGMKTKLATLDLLNCKLTKYDISPRTFVFSRSGSHRLLFFQTFGQFLINKSHKKYIQNFWGFETALYKFRKYASWLYLEILSVTIRKIYWTHNISKKMRIIKILFEKTSFKMHQPNVSDFHSKTSNVGALSFLHNIGYRISVTLYTRSVMFIDYSSTLYHDDEP